MTLPLNDRITSTYDTNGLLTDFNFDFRIFYNTDNASYGLEVRKIVEGGYEVINPSLYTVVPNEGLTSGKIVFAVAPPTGQQIYIAGKTPTIQQLNLTNYGRFSAEAIEVNFDFVIAIIQEWLTSLSIERAERIANDSIVKDYTDDLYANWQSWAETNVPIFAATYLAGEIDSFEQSWIDALNQITLTSIPALAVPTANGQNQQEVNDSIGARWYSRVSGYNVNDRVSLTNGTVVKSTIPNNTNDPNSDMTGWSFANSDGEIITFSGRTQQNKNRDFMTVEDYGANGDGVLHPLSEKYGTLALAKFAYANIADRVVSLSQSIDWAAFQSAVQANAAVYAVKPVYCLNDALEIPHGSRLLGAGTDTWDMASTTGKPNAMTRGTTLLFSGTPWKTTTVFGVTRNSLTGGVITNPSPATTEFSTYELTDFTNRNASGTTPATLKALKCAVVLNESHNSALRDIRILKSYNGIAGYNDDTLLGIGDDWDIGLLVLNSSFADLYSVQSVGYWKMFGGVQINSEHKSVGTSKMGEGTYNLYSKCIFQGATGFGFRGSDEHKVLTSSGSTFSIPYDTSNLVAVGDTLTDGSTVWTVNSASVSGNTLVIVTTGAAPSIGVMLRQVRYNFGVAGVQMRDCMITGLFHKSRRSAKDVGLSKNTAGLEISGGILRDIDFDNVHVFDGEVVAFINNVDDVNFKGSYFEAHGIKDLAGTFTASGARFIVTGATTDSAATYPIEGCKNLTMDQSTEVGSTVDLFPYNISRPARFVDAGLFMPFSFAIDANGSQTENRFPKSRSETLIKCTGLYSAQRKIRMVTSGFTNLMQIFESGNVLIGDGTTASTKLHLYTPAGETISANHDFCNDAPVAAIQLRTRSAGRWWRNLVDGGGYKVTYSGGQSSSYTSTAFYFNPDASTPEMAIGGITRPIGDNAYTLGAAGSRWSVVYAGTATINTSDERQKEQIQSLSEVEKLVAAELKPLVKKFKFKDAVLQKGDDARWHIGFIAQEVIATFEKHGLDAFKYGIACYDEWDGKAAVYNDDGDEIEPELVAGNLYGLRHDELIFFIISSL